MPCGKHNVRQTWQKWKLNRLCRLDGRFAKTKLNCFDDLKNKFLLSLLMFIFYKAQQSGFQWWKVTEYIYSSTVLLYNFRVLELEYFHLKLLYNSTELYFGSQYCTFLLLLGFLQVRVRQVQIIFAKNKDSNKNTTKHLTSINNKRKKLNFKVQFFKSVPSQPSSKTNQWSCSLLCIKESVSWKAAGKLAVSSLKCFFLYPFGNWKLIRFIVDSELKLWHT